ncbi:MAG: MmgE/PrpD family protein [Dehalococcoidia bacterium]
MADSISRQFARWAANLKYEDLPPEVVSKTKAFVLHALTSAVLGGPEPKAHHAVEFTLREEGKADGATIMWEGGKATRIGATFANAEIMHTSGLIDSYRMLTHPGPVIVPAAIVNAELEKKNGKDLIVALVVGYELVFRLCDEFIPATAARGFRPSPIYCTLGTALTTGKLLGLGEDGLAACIAFAANTANALNQSSTEGGGDNAMHEPNAARQGVFAAMMAKETGNKGSEHVIEGVAGFYNAVTGNHEGRIPYSFHEGKTQVDMASVTAGLGTEYRLLTAMFRMYPFAAYNQPVIDLMQEMKIEHNINHEDIERLDVHMNWIETLYPSPAFPRYPDFDVARVEGGRGTTHLYAAHSAVNGGYPVIGGKTYGPTGWDLTGDQVVNEFARTKVHLVQEKDRAMFSPAITVTMKDGTVHRGEYPYHPRLEWTFDQLAKRLEDCLPGLATGAAGLQKLIDVSQNLDQHASVQPLLDAVKKP